MGIYTAPKKCYFTQLDTTNISSEEDCIEYSIFNGTDTIRLKLSNSYNWENSRLIKDHNVVFRGDILNNKWPSENLLLDGRELEKHLATSTAPKTPKEKLDNLFSYLFNKQRFDGVEFAFTQTFNDPREISRLYFQNSQECLFYLNTLESVGLIKMNNFQGSFISIDIALTFKGLNYQIELSESGNLSKNAFVAMSFGAGMKDIRDAIKTSIIETGFHPLLVDEVHIDPDRTINDEIIALIKKSKFCICDFTEQKDGVYFEAGYALGRGMKVIYTCQDKWFNQSHFDTNHFPHIIYQNHRELYDKLKLKIEAWV